MRKTGLIFNLQLFAEKEKDKLLAKIKGLAEKQKALVDKAKSEDNRALTEDEIKEFDDWQKEIEGLKKQVEIAEKMEQNEKFLDEPSTEKVLPADGIQGEVLDDGGFKSIGELACAVKYGDKKGRLKDLMSGDVGILIPPKFASEILKLDGEGEIVMPRATNIPAGDPPDAPFTIPYLQQGNDGALGGVELVWTGEGKPVADVNDPNLKDLTLTPQEVSGMATLSNKTLQNWEASGALIQSLLRQAYINGRDYKFLRGSGAGCPLGILNAPGAIEINRDTSATVKYIDLVTMFSRLYAGDGEPVWTINQTLMPTLMTLQDPAGHYIFNAGDATKGIPATLLGLPIKWNGKTPLLGKKGDVMLAKLKYYLTKAGSGPYIAISEHVKFTTNKTVFKIVANIDGQPWVLNPLKLEDGETTVSPYVILE